MAKIDKSKLVEGIKLLIWCNEIHRETIVTITYTRLNVIFFTYDEFPDKRESWLPTGSYIVEKATIQNSITKNDIKFLYYTKLGIGTKYYCEINNSPNIVFSIYTEFDAIYEAKKLLKEKYNLDYNDNEIQFRYDNTI